MRISARADYAVRAAIELAALGAALGTAPADRPGTGPAVESAAGPGGWTKAERVADAQAIPLPFLLNIFKSLRDAGLVEAKRGTDGGHRLALPAAQISVAAVVRAVDGPLASVAGVLVEDLAYTGNAVALRDTWVALRCSIRSVLEAVTLADLAAQQLPTTVLDLLGGADAFTTRPQAREHFQRRVDPA